MDKRLRDILEEEQIQVNERAELDRRVELAETKLQKLYLLLEQGDDELLPFIERRREEIAGMKEMQIEYQQELNGIRKQISDCVRDMLDVKNFKYLPPIKRKDITEEEAIEMLIKANEKRKNRRRASTGVTTRKGRVKYVKTNKIQN